MGWVYLALAGLFEIGWAVGLKSSHGFTRFWPSLVTIVSMVLSLALLGVSLRTLPLGTAYAVWTGIGTVGTALLAIMLFGESADVPRLLFIGLIIAGIVGLKMAGGHDRPSGGDDVEQIVTTAHE